jgi:hypothetical protein
MKKKRIQTRKPTKEPLATQASPPVASFVAALERNLDDRPEVLTLLRRIKKGLPALERLLAESGAAFEHPFYRFYHQSFKVYRVQALTEKLVEALQGLAPDRALNPCFVEIVQQGTGKVFELEHNSRWNETTRPMLEAFTHARYFLEMVVRYGRTLDEPPLRLPEGWASVLYLYGFR